MVYLYENIFIYSNFSYNSMNFDMTLKLKLLVHKFNIFIIPNFTILLCSVLPINLLVYQF